VKLFWKLAYRLVVLPVLWGGFHISGLLNGKVRAGIRGRKGVVSRARVVRASLGNKPLLLFHCASMGELEALYPLANKLREKNISLGVIHFSPSAEEAAKKADCFAYADYSPTDIPREVRRFLQELRPLALAITKHDIWPNLVWGCRDHNIPVFLINASFSPKSTRFWPVARSFQKTLMSSFRAILAISDDDAKRARRIIPRHVRLIVAGDSRYDRVVERTKQSFAELPSLQNSVRDHFVLVAGSTHSADEEILLPAITAVAQRHPDFLCLLVPHDPLPSALKQIETKCRDIGLDFLLLSQWQGQPIKHVLCVDRVGILAPLYGLGHAAYVGGGFDRGVHSVIEPMAHGLPVLCGPKIEVSHEALLGNREGVLQLARNASEVENWVEELLSDERRRHEMGDKARSLVEKRLGAATRIADFLQKELGLS
jgi:3-deoxy-D-manno-octulosonic-acid transferase